MRNRVASHRERVHMYLLGVFQKEPACFYHWWGPFQFPLTLGIWASDYLQSQVKFKDSGLFSLSLFFFCCRATGPALALIFWYKGEGRETFPPVIMCKAKEVSICSWNSAFYGVCQAASVLMDLNDNILPFLLLLETTTLSNLSHYFFIRSRI